ncbi:MULTISPECIES: response regulator [Thermodesulfovibrio]|jgi:CheY-like chemotaxis protein|uniref:Sensory box histidine kinase/response regulator n=1 Tax=Thermodesulfovibrio yellowstonii (strain ATCC 51303 / DSM 11347 / YP87) TaxID=289376 RepID=B5YHH5_THEYD|nr:MULTISPECIES: response regulator [Thermodesulfovibrio]ACI21489.1 sensory box histidine kinase/response regulator [Thermodesulfovibrio yellowstonii DSM 11347]MDI6865261.1 response regulator [Thermodesulfovibrio yellowstonii]
MSKRALVIEDNELVRETLKALLEFLNFEVITAENGEIALEKFVSQLNSNNFFDVILVDLVMPGMSGKEVIQELKKYDPNVNALISSGYFNDSSIVEYEKLGFKGVLNKPYTLEELKEVLKKLNLI